MHTVKTIIFTVHTVIGVINTVCITHAEYKYPYKLVYVTLIIIYVTTNNSIEVMKTMQKHNMMC